MVASGGGGGGTMIFSYVGSDHFGVYQINEYFSGMKILWIFLRGHHKLDKLGGISMYFGYLLKVQVQNLGYFGYFWVAKILRMKKNESPPSPLL